MIATCLKLYYMVGGQVNDWIFTGKYPGSKHYQSLEAHFCSRKITAGSRLGLAGDGFVVRSANPAPLCLSFVHANARKGKTARHELDYPLANQVISRNK
jgi:hypothetical protein